MAAHVNFSLSHNIYTHIMFQRKVTRCIDADLRNNDILDSPTEIIISLIIPKCNEKTGNNIYYEETA